MTTEEKAKAYDKAVKIINDYYQKIKYSSLSCASNDREVLEKAFPQIKESDDERIRKALAAFFAKFKSDDMWDDDFSCGDIVAWFEKQKAIDILDEEEREFADNVDSYRKEVDAAYQKGYNEGVKTTLEKQGEQEPADKVEPKFKKGDWVTIKE